MRAWSSLVLFSLLLGFVGVAEANDDDDTTRSLTMTCEYADYGSWEREAISIGQTTESLGTPATVKVFPRGGNPKETFLVRPGQFAECIYPSGTHVRVKVGNGEARAYGRCGGDPEAFMSLWVNQRKIASRVWFAGRCREDDRAPAVSFQVASRAGGIFVQKCHSIWQPAATPAPAPGGPQHAAPKKLSVCVDFPDVSAFPRDTLEYPTQGTTAPKAGDIELLNGSNPVCHAVRDELTAYFYSFSSEGDSSKAKLPRPTWSNSSVALPKELAGSVEGVFDFDNDGRLDRVFSRGFWGTYMDGSVLLVQPGASLSMLNVPESPLDMTSIFLPCQLGTVHYDIRDCPPFSQKGDDAGFSMEGRTAQDSVYFRARYSSVSPFNFQGANFLGVSSMSEDTKDYVAVLKPLANRKYQGMCLLRRVPENF